MRLSRILAICATGLGAFSAADAFGQGQQQYETPAYTTPAPETLDKNFGLPVFGRPEAQLPQQRTMTTVAPDRSLPDFFARPADRPLPGTPAPDTSSDGLETPLYTTGDGATSRNWRASPTDSRSTGRRMETPLYTTLDGTSGGDGMDAAEGDRSRR